MFNFVQTDRGTLMKIFLGTFNIEIEIYGSIPRRLRRVILLAIFYRINHLFELVKPSDTEHSAGAIAHMDGLAENKWRDLDRGIKLRQALKTESPLEQRGFEIRTLRLRKGHSQKKLAQALGLDRGNISEIEKGRHRGKAATLERIIAYLESQTDKPTFDKSKTRREKENERIAEEAKGKWRWVGDLLLPID
jgi:DNA-binding XRE family transcriptional regulator